MGVTPQIKRLMNKRNNRRPKYSNGYSEKIGYWSYKVNCAIEVGNTEKLEYAASRLVYFLQRQQAWEQEQAKSGAIYEITSGWE